MATRISINIKIANFINDELHDIIEFDGSKVQCKEWFNKNYGIYKLKENEPSVVININNKGWGFFEDYVKKGVILI